MQIKRTKTIMQTIVLASAVIGIGAVADFTLTTLRAPKQPVVNTVNEIYDNSAESKRIRERLGKDGVIIAVALSPFVFEMLRGREESCRVERWHQ